MLEVLLDYDPSTRELKIGSESGDYASTIIDNLSTKITVRGIPEGYAARMEFKVQARDVTGKVVYPFLVLDDGSCVLTDGIMRACHRDWKLPIQLVLAKGNERIASRGILVLQVSTAIDALGGTIDSYEPQVLQAFIKADLIENGDLIFTDILERESSVNIIQVLTGNVPGKIPLLSGRVDDGQVITYTAGGFYGSDVYSGQYHLMGSVPTLTDLQNKAPNIGEGWIVEQGGSIYEGDGTAWVNKGKVIELQWVTDGIARIDMKDAEQDTRLDGVIPRSISGHIVTGAYLVSNSVSVSLMLDIVSPADGTASIITVPLPVANEGQAGVTSAGQIIQMNQNSADVQVLLGRPMRFVVELTSSAPTQEQLNDAYNAIVPAPPSPPIDGTTLLDISYNKEYMWFESSSQWVDRGNASVSKATNTSMGIVKGSLTGSGVIFVEDDGSMTVLGWDAISALLNNHVGDGTIHLGTSSIDTSFPSAPADTKVPSTRLVDTRASAIEADTTALWVKLNDTVSTVSGITEILSRGNKPILYTDQVVQMLSDGTAVTLPRESIQGKMDSTVDYIVSVTVVTANGNKSHHFPQGTTQTALVWDGSLMYEMQVIFSTDSYGHWESVRILLTRTDNGINQPTTCYVTSVAMGIVPK